MKAKVVGRRGHPVAVKVACRPIDSCTMPGVAAVGEGVCSVV